LFSYRLKGSQEQQHKRNGLKSRPKPRQQIKFQIFQYIKTKIMRCTLRFA